MYIYIYSISMSIIYIHIIIHTQLGLKSWTKWVYPLYPGTRFTEFGFTSGRIRPAFANCCTTYFKMFGGAYEALKFSGSGSMAFDIKNCHFNMFNEENHLMIPYNSMNTYNWHVLHSLFRDVWTHGLSKIFGVPKVATNHCVLECPSCDVRKMVVSPWNLRSPTTYIYLH